MGSFHRLSLFLPIIVLIIIHHQALTTTAQPTYVYHFCYGANYTANSTFQANLNLLLPSLSSSNNKIFNKNGYRNATAGRNPDTVYGSLQCRGDVTSEACQECVDTAAPEITEKWCPNSEQAIVWYDECMLRYSNQSFFSIMQQSPAVYLWNLNNVSNPDQFNRILGGLMDDLVKEAVSDGSVNFATGEANFTTFRKIYGLVQCTADISSSNCNRCLQAAITELPNCCDGKQGGRVIRPSCNFRYEIYPFFQSRKTAAPPTASPVVLPPPTQRSRNTTTTNSKGKNSSRIITAIVVPAIITVLLSAIIIWFFCSKRRKETKQIDVVDEIQSAESLQFNLSTIRAATDNFSAANKLGEGGFGSVYKGTLSDGQEIAVKRLSENSCQGEEEFKNEVVLVAKLQHRNLVRLLGFCLEGEEKLLIYEFMSNTSLDQFIFDSTKCTYLDWERRYKIIGGIARGLLYLHEDSRLTIIHRDLKASNILLDTDMTPKISDFGMARLFLVDQTQANTNRIVGTYGYMAPEYAMHGHFSVKSDVFSFGVLVLEILSGQKNNHFYESEVAQDLLSYAWRHWKSGTASEFLDPTLRESCSTSEMMRCIHIGLLCVQEDIADRPTMASIVLMLNSYSTMLPLPSPPAFFGHSRMAPTIYTGDSEEATIVSDQSTSKSTALSGDGASITDLYPR